MKKNKKKSKGPESIDNFAMRELGAVFRRERERRHLSQGEIAKRIKKSKTAIVYYEQGTRPIHWGTFIRLCSAIRVSPAFVIERWMQKNSFDVLDESRRKEYHQTIDEMIKYGFSKDLDTLMVYFQGLIEREKEIRKRIRQTESIQKEYYALKDLHQFKKDGEEDKGENGF